MVAIRDASYFIYSILAKDSIVVFFLEIALENNTTHLC